MSNENKKRGKLIVYTGCSGVGKGTIMEYLLKEFPELQFSVSATTRDPRPGEEHGVHYFFITHDEFNRMIENDEFLEHAVYCENQYGTPRKIVEDKLSEGINVILEIEVVGGTNVISRFPECVSIFILPPSIEELGRRLRKRGCPLTSAGKNDLEVSGGCESVEVLPVEADPKAFDDLECFNCNTHSTQKRFQIILI